MMEVSLREFQTLWGRLGRKAVETADSLQVLLLMFLEAVRIESRRSRDGEHWACAELVNPADHTAADSGPRLAFAVNDDDEGHAHDIYAEIARVAYDSDCAARPTPVLAVRVSHALRNRLVGSPIPFVVLDAPATEAVFHSDRPSNEFAALLRQRTAADVGNPFQSAGPLVSGQMFYGRANEIKEIVHAKGMSFAVLGARRSGKTSLLYRVREQIEASAEAKAGKRSVLYVDLAPHQRADDAILEIAARLEPQFAVRGEPGKFSHLLEVLSRGGRQYVLLLDECDSVILDDMNTGERLCKALTGSPAFRFALAGNIHLQQTARSWKNRIGNTLTQIHLQELDAGSAQNLIHDPFLQRHIETPTGHDWKAWAATQDHDNYRNSENWIDYVLAQTGRRPALIQLYGYQLYRQLKHEGRDRLLPEDIGAAEAASVRAETVDSFLIAASPLARVLALTLMESQAKGMTEADLHSRLRRLIPSISLPQTLNAMSELESVGLIQVRERTWFISYPGFPSLLRRYHDCGFLMGEALKTLKGD